MRVLLCACENKQQAVLEEVSDYLKHSAQVEIASNLCKTAKSFPREKAVIACTDGSKLRRAIKKAGVNPFRIQIAELGRSSSAERAKLAVNAALNRAAVFDINAESLRMSRGNYEVVARINHGKCSRCSLCINACPHDAISKEINKAKCEACGVCVAACPNGAIALDNYAPEVLDAEMRGLLAKDVAYAPKILAFTCAHYSPADGKLLSVKLPCMGMLSPFLLLRAFDLGCDAAMVIACPEGRCPHGVKHEKAHALVRLAKEILDAFGIDSWRVAFFTAEEEQEIKKFAGSINPVESNFEPSQFDYNFAKLLKNFSENRKLKKELTLKHDALPFGIVTASAEKCTSCGLCFYVCPTKAFSMQAEGNKVKLSFSYSRCSACMLCEQKCPEKALRVERVFDLKRMLGDSEITLVEQELVFCEKCGTGFATAKMQEKILNAVAKNEQLKKALKLCPECRSNIEPV